MTEKRFGMYQNTLYDDGNILNPFDAMKLLNHFDKENTKLKEENEQLREHFIYLIATALEDKECRKIYAKGLLEIFDDCDDLDEAKIKIREYLE